MKLTINNHTELSAWMNQRRAIGHDMVSVKGPAPEGATYSDGTPIEGLVNIRWRDVVTGEVCDIDYSEAIATTQGVLK